MKNAANDLTNLQNALSASRLSTGSTVEAVPKAAIVVRGTHSACPGRSVRFRCLKTFLPTYRDQMRFDLVAQDVGVALRDAGRSVTSWCRRHTIGGDGAVAAVRRGQRPGESGALSREQELG
jgi:hypothetical protein